MNLGIAVLGAAVGALAVEALRNREVIQELRKSITDLGMELDDRVDRGSLEALRAALSARLERFEASDVAHLATKLKDEFEVLQSRLNGLNAPQVRRHG